MKAVCLALLLCSLLPLCLAQWTIATTNGVLSATNGDFVFEVKTVESDPVYDQSAIDVKPIFGEGVPTAVDDPKKAALQAQLKPLFPTSLNVVLKHKGKAIFALAEGKPTDFAKTVLGGAINKEVHTALAAALKTLTTDDERIGARLRSVGPMIEGVLQDRSKDALASTKGLTTGAQGGFLELNRNLRRQRAGVESRTKLAGDIRYYVDIYIGNAFGIPLGHHSASEISVRNDTTGAIINTFVRCNHGRCPTDNGMAFKCSHRGAAHIDHLAAQPASWDCTTPYWAVYCPNGPNHNCNANAQHQIQISDSPAAPPGDAVGICATDCPRASPNC